MLTYLPQYIALIFALATFITLRIFIQAVKDASSEKVKCKVIVVYAALVIWLFLQAFLSARNVYKTGLTTLPPKIVLFGILPPLLTIIILFVTTQGRKFVDSLPLKHLTYLHTVRILVELVLYWLFLHKAVPQLMTFEGRNFDMLAGITAPVVAWLFFSKHKLNKRILLVWNFVSLALLLNIVVNAFLSTPSPLQQFAFDQPNIAILNTPFSWLPTFIVPVVLFSHLAAIRQLLKIK